jgi:anti-sigma B factor antagonist
MILNTQENQGVDIVSIEGSIDALTAGEVQQYFNDLIGKGVNRVIINLDQVDFMSSAGLRVIMAASKGVRQQGGDLRLAAAQPGVEKMLKISGFTSILKSFYSVDEALSSFVNGASQSDGSPA